MRPTVFDCNVAVLDIAGLGQASLEVEERTSCRPLKRRGAKVPNHRHRLLRPCRDRPRRRATEQRDELASFHSITSSARPDSVGGTSMTSAFAVLRLSTNSNLVDCTTGRSAGFAPLRMRPA